MHDDAAGIPPRTNGCELHRAMLFLLCLVRTAASMRITSKGQVTIPQSIREQAGLMPGTEVEFFVEQGAVRLRKAGGRPGLKSRGETLVARLRGAGDFGMSTDEIVTLMRGPPADDDAPPIP